MLAARAMVFLRFLPARKYADRTTGRNKNRNSGELKSILNFVKRNFTFSLSEIGASTEFPTGRYGRELRITRYRYIG